MDRQNIQTIYGLSPQQKGILFETQVAAPGLYVEQTAAPIAGALNVEALRHAWQRLVDRHEVLRTAFVWKDQPEPLQVVLRRLKLPVLEIDIRRQSGREQEEQVAGLMASQRLQPFDVGKPPLMRVALARIGEESHYLIWTQHHILMDGWCMPVIFDEFLRLYRSFCAGQDPSSPTGPQYRRYIEWLNRQDQGSAERFWRDALAGFSRPTPLGWEDPSFRPLPEAERFGLVAQSVPAADTDALKALAREKRLTLNSLLQGAWALLLARFGGSPDVVFGVTVSGRPPELPGVEQIIGLFMNTVPCRARIDPEASIAAWLADLQSSQARARDFEYCSTGQIHEWTEVPRSVRLYESVLVIENYPGGGRPEGEDPGRGKFIGARTVYTLTLMVEMGGELRITAIYDSSRIEGSDVSHILAQFLSTLRLLASHREGRVDDVLNSIPADRIPRLRPTGEAALPESRADDEPQSPVEAQVAEICQGLLGLKSVPLTRNFFELGGHSLLVTRLASRIREDFSLELPLRIFFEARSLRDLAAAIEDALLLSIEDLTEEEARRLVEKSGA